MERLVDEYVPILLRLETKRLSTKRFAHNAFLLTVTCAVLSLLCACGASKSGGPYSAVSTVRSNTLRRGIGGEPATLDPSQAADSFSFEVIRDTYEGLTTESPDGAVIPGVAASWTISKSGTTYRFKLRHNARWSNGARISPRDFIKAWQRVVNPSVGSPAADALRPILGASEIIAGHLPASALGVTAGKGNSLVVKLKEPTPYFLQLLTHTALFPIYSESSAETHSARNWVSNGPYILLAWVPGESIELTKNQYYWDRHNVRIHNVSYVIEADENSELRQYLAGQIDLTESVPTNALATLKQKRPQELHIQPFLGTAYYALNLRGSLFRNNRPLRQALAMAIDRPMLVARVLEFGQKPAFSFVPPGTWNYAPQSWEWSSMSDTDRIAKARQLYRQAGYSFGKPLRIRMLINSNALIREAAIATAAMWQSVLGVRTRIIEQEYRVFLQSRRDPSLWDVARLGWTADYDDASDFLDILRTDSPNNDARYSNSAFDALMNLAVTTIDPAKRRSILEQAEKKMLSDYPIIPIYSYVSKRLVKPYVGGVRQTNMDRLYSKYLFFKAH